MASPGGAPPQEPARAEPLSPGPALNREFRLWSAGDTLWSATGDTLWGGWEPWASGAEAPGRVGQGAEASATLAERTATGADAVELLGEKGGALPISSEYLFVLGSGDKAGASWEWASESHLLPSPGGPASPPPERGSDPMDDIELLDQMLASGGWRQDPGSACPGDSGSGTDAEKPALGQRGALVSDAAQSPSHLPSAASGVLPLGQGLGEGGGIQHFPQDLPSLSNGFPGTPPSTFPDHGGTTEQRPETAIATPEATQLSCCISQPVWPDVETAAVEEGPLSWQQLGEAPEAPKEEVYAVRDRTPRASTPELSSTARSPCTLNARDGTGSIASVVSGASAAGAPPTGLSGSTDSNSSPGVTSAGTSACPAAFQRGTLRDEAVLRSDSRGQSASAPGRPEGEGVRIADPDLVGDGLKLWGSEMLLLALEDLWAAGSNPGPMRAAAGAAKARQATGKEEEASRRCAGKCPSEALSWERPCPSEGRSQHSQAQQPGEEAGHAASAVQQPPGKISLSSRLAEALGRIQGQRETTAVTTLAHMTSALHRGGQACDAGVSRGPRDALVLGKRRQAGALPSATQRAKLPDILARKPSPFLAQRESHKTTGMALLPPKSVSSAAEFEAKLEVTLKEKLFMAAQAVDQGNHVRTMPLLVLAPGQAAWDHCREAVLSYAAVDPRLVRICPSHVLSRLPVRACRASSMRS